MSPYEEVQITVSDKPTLEATAWAFKSSKLVIYHLTLRTAQKEKGLLDYLHEVFNEELRSGRSYPQEAEMARQTFEGYFFGADVFLALNTEDPEESLEHQDWSTCPIDLGCNSMDVVRQGRKWEDCVVGFYYVKSNYPGRSSHICNGGFITVPQHRGMGVGRVLALSFLHYAPKLGYKGSVFNLVYETNVASIRLWEGLNFTKVGKIPRAGRLRRTDGEGEEYVDAWVIYKSFE